MNYTRWAAAPLAILALLTALAGCASPSAEGGTEPSPAPGRGDATLVIGAYSVAKDAFAELLPMFQEQW